MTKLKLLIQVLHSIDIYHQFSDTLFFQNQIINTQIEMYIMHLVWFPKFYSLLS